MPRKQAHTDEEGAMLVYPNSSTETGNAPPNHHLPSDHQPFLTLEETTTADTSALEELTARKRTGNNKNPSALEIMNDDDDDKSKQHKVKSGAPSTIKTAAASVTKACSTKKAISYTVFGFLLFVMYDALFVPPDKRLFQADAATDSFLRWVQEHPAQGLIAIILVIAAAVVVLIPIGTPLTLGCGYIYKGAYGWKIGLTVATLASMGGSALGAVICFLLGRYMLRDQVRQWARDKYPLFDAIDAAAAEHGLKIMAMLYLTPILPLGPVSYMCGTTSMALSSFVLAKIASLPLMLLYCFIGASTRSLISSSGKASSEDMKSIEDNESLIAGGILMSFVMITMITRYIQKELNTILERQGKHKPGEKKETSTTDSEASALELGKTSSSAPRQRRAA